MKNLITLLALLLLSIPVFAQAPEKLSYQAVIRDATDMLVTDSSVGMQISILDGSATGTPVYVETQTPTTNINGLVSIEVGAGTVVSGDFSTIDWGGSSFWIKTETDPTGGTSYTIEGTSQLLSVPYALFAKNTTGGSGNTLDEAYDAQVAPGTRTITADDGKIEIVSSGNRALELSPDAANEALVVNSTGTADGIQIINDGSGEGLTMDNDSTGTAVEIDNTDSAGDGVDISNDTGGDALTIDNGGPGDAVFIDNLDGVGGFALSISHDGGGDAVDILNDGDGNTLAIDNNGDGNAVSIDNTDTTLGTGILLNHDGDVAGIQINTSAFGAGLFVDQDGDGPGITVDNVDGSNVGIWVINSSVSSGIDVFDDGGASAITIDNSGGGDGLFVSNNDAGNGIEVSNDGTGNGLEIVNVGDGKAANIANGPGGAGNALMVTQESDVDAVMIDNAGEAKGLMIFNGNPFASRALEIVQGGAATAAFIENAGPARGMEVMNIGGGNPSTVIFGSTAGTGVVGEFFTDDNDTNTSPTIVGVNSGAGSAADFSTLDNPTGGRINFSPTVNIGSTGRGIGLNVRILNDLIGPSENVEPAIFADHAGYGQTAHFETINSLNTSHTMEIISNGQGNGLHIDMFGSPLALADDALHVEQSNTSVIASSGLVALFEMQVPGTSADAAVQINSAATSAAHSALRVIPASPTSMAATFEGNVEVASDITIGGTMTAAVKAFKIDHPLDPENKYLMHNSIESNERINIYSGNITTDTDGYATVQLPDYMSALNTNFKYQLTIVDKSFAQAIIWEPMDTNTNTFVIKTNKPNIKVSWQMTGTRHDKWSLENPLEVEVDKNNGF